MLINLFVLTLKPKKKHKKVNLFETPIPALSGNLSAYHLSGGEQGTMNVAQNGPNLSIY